LDRGVILLSTGPRRSEAEGGPRIVIREGVYCNRYTMFDASERIEIGARTMIGPHCYITDHDHGIRRHMPIPKQPLIGAPVVIGHDAWLGAGVTILKGVTIGEGAIVAANAVVTKDVPPFSIVAGVPAKVIGERPE
ncbi:MAG: acyltransferase, partial [Planctomycetota bacterium]